MITQEELKALLHYDPVTGNFTRLTRTAQCVKVGDIAGSTNRLGYVALWILGKRYAAHRVAWFYIHGYWPTKTIDHINLIRNDNRLVNLREATAAENNINRDKQSNNTSGCTGVTWDKSKRKWLAQCSVNGKRYNLGRFHNFDDAQSVYQEFSSKHHGEFKRSQSRHC